MSSFDSAVDNMKHHEVTVDVSYKVDGKVARSKAASISSVRIPAYINSRDIANGEVLRIRGADTKVHKTMFEKDQQKREAEARSVDEAPPAKAAKTKGKKGKGKGKSK